MFLATGMMFLNEIFCTTAYGRSNFSLTQLLFHALKNHQNSVGTSLACGLPHYVVKFLFNVVALIELAYLYVILCRV